MMTLVPAGEEDHEFARQVHHTAYRGMVTRQFGEWEEAVQDGFFERTWESLPHHIILDDESRRCGYCAIRRTESAVILCEIAILPERQGQGIGGQILQSLISEGDEQGLPVKLNVMKSNLRGRQFYERHGFRQVGEIATHFLMERPWSGAGM